MNKMEKGLNKTTEPILKSGNSQAMSLSEKTIQLTDFNVGDSVEVTRIHGGLFITKKEEAIEDRIKKFFKMAGNIQKQKWI
ncbi:MAG: AbrB family transcriptional regulator [Staphylococcus rostri]|nr:AbrB family transcriptional regulator [Staphylococcus rostri]MDO5375105.1 AbrB family transcriptional regulator [Staphylococcus rostri]